MATWACGSPDGNPTTADYDCESDEWDSASDRVLVPDLQIGPSDIDPSFTCTGDGIEPGSGEIRVTIHNTGDGPVTDDFTVEFAELTTGYAVTDTFGNLAGPGALPLAAGSSETLVFGDWSTACDACDYTIEVTLDAPEDVKRVERE